MRAALQFLRVERERNPDVGLAAGLKIRRTARELKIGGQHADHRVTIVVQRDVLSCNVSIGPEPLLPNAVAQNRHVVVPRPVLLGKKIAAQREANSQEMEETRRNTCPKQ